MTPMRTLPLDFILSNVGLPVRETLVATVYGAADSDEEVPPDPPEPPHADRTSASAAAAAVSTAFLVPNNDISCVPFITGTEARVQVDGGISG